ncbi:hypothetical protein RFI_02488 [Reticulomyxa filosa]|uniref:Uncharacterized protein n=1 Tax=Reticulomyxa filosa TaxID=46433 RepID=X6PAC7_RETFI|nr:hypothetical protein RFI_02488 [Reticulomyxa filosa]|eukprot:ETO34602.1 hypothetical protein RFI_02488 [Reticulomyxa filosa]
MKDKIFVIDKKLTIFYVIAFVNARNNKNSNANLLSGNKYIVCSWSCCKSLILDIETFVHKLDSLISLNKVQTGDNDKVNFSARSIQICSSTASVEMRSGLNCNKGHKNLFQLSVRTTFVISQPTSVRHSRQKKLRQLLNAQRMKKYGQKYEIEREIAQIFSFDNPTAISFRQLLITQVSNWTKKRMSRVVLEISGKICDQEKEIIFFCWGGGGQQQKTKERAIAT